MRGQANCKKIGRSGVAIRAGVMDQASPHVVAHTAALPVIRVMHHRRVKGTSREGNFAVWCRDLTIPAKREAATSSSLVAVVKPGAERPLQPAPHPL
jgi:hypothetical protein